MFTTAYHHDEVEITYDEGITRQHLDEIGTRDRLGGGGIPPLAISRSRGHRETGEAAFEMS